MLYIEAGSNKTRITNYESRQLAEMFKIKNKKIRRIEAVMVRLPYGSGTGWD